MFGGAPQISPEQSQGIVAGDISGNSIMVDLRTPRGSVGMRVSIEQLGALAHYELAANQSSRSVRGLRYDMT